MKRTNTFEKKELSLYIQANNSIYSLLEHEKHQSSEIPLNMNILTFKNDILEKKLASSLILNKETLKVSNEFRYNLTLFSIFHLFALSILIISVSVMYTFGNVKRDQFMLQITLLLIILSLSLVFIYLSVRVKQILISSKKIITALVTIMTFYLTLTDFRVFGKAVGSGYSGGNILIIGFYVVSMRHVCLESFKNIVFIVFISLVISLIFILVFADNYLASGLNDFFILFFFLLVESFDTYQADLRIKQLFWRKEKEQSSDENLVEENSEHNFTNLGTEIEVIIQSCDRIRKTIKTASDVIMYKDVKAKLKIAQLELERVKRRIATGSIMDVVKLEHHPNISENDRLFIYENFTDLSRNNIKRKSKLNESHVYPAPKWASEVAEFEELMGCFGVIWNFDIWFVYQTTGSPLYMGAKYLLNKWLLSAQLDLNPTTTDNYFLTLEHVMFIQSYKNNPYHNSSHATDVLHNIMYFYTNSDIINWLNPLELLSSIIAALGHDVAHPAFNNKYLINSRDEIALVYNDRSVLENMHASKTFDIMKKEGCNFLLNLSFDDWFSVRKLVISMIMETDMAKHFEVLGKFRSRVSTLNDIDLQKTEDKEFVMNMAIKCADIGHAAKSLELHEKWTAFVCEEFFHQGDLEKENGLPVSMYCDRNNTDIPKSQAGFIKNICLPLYETWSNYLKSENIFKNCIEQLKINLKNWEEKDKKVC